MARVDPAARAGRSSRSRSASYCTGTYVGPDGIADFYAGQAFTVPDLQPQTGPFVIDGNRVAVEIVLQMHGQKSRIADFFEIRDGLIQRLTIYLGGAA